MKTYTMEHKTTSEDCGLGSVYWKKLILDAQVSTYMMGARSLGFEPDGVLYDVLRKPALRPLEANSRRSSPETPEEYFNRLNAEIADKPNHYYQRGVIVRLEEEEREAAFDAWHTASSIREARNANVWPRNVDSCSQYNRLCDYWPVCSGEASIDDALLYEEAPTSELREKLTLPLLSDSSARSFRACPRRYFYAYEKRIRSRSKAGALSFGTAIHKALEAWLPERKLTAALAALVGLEPYDKAKAEAMLVGYDFRWSSEPLEVVSVETEFTAPLVNPTTGRKSPLWIRGGRLDAIVRTTN